VIGAAIVLENLSIIAGNLLSTNGGFLKLDFRAF